MLYILVLFVCFGFLWLFYICFLGKPVDLASDLIVITGAANGIGRHLSILLSKYCSRIIAIDKNVQGLKETASLVLKDSGVSLLCYECDLTDPKAIKMCAEDIRKRHGRVTVLINNAGIVNGNFFVDIPIEKVQKLIAVNFLAPFYLVKEFLPGMLGSAYKSAIRRIPRHLRVVPQDDNSERCFGCVPPRGHLVFISSIASQTIACGLADYCASKAAISAMADTLRLELDALALRDHIAVTDIRPFVINTTMFEGFTPKMPILPILRVEKTARRIVDAIRYRKRTVYLPWTIWFIPLIQRIFPFPILVFFYKITGAFDGMNSFKHANKKHD